MYSGLVFLCCSVILLSFLLSANRLLNCLIVLENLNVLLLFLCLLSQVEEFRMIFISLLVIFTIEITLALVVLTRIWNLSSLVDIVGL